MPKKCDSQKKEIRAGMPTSSTKQRVFALCVELAVLFCPISSPALGQGPGVTPDRRRPVAPQPAPPQGTNGQGGTPPVFVPVPANGPPGQLHPGAPPDGSHAVQPVGQPRRNNINSSGSTDGGNGGGSSSGQGSQALRQASQESGDDAVKGLRNFYGLINTGYGQQQLERCDPSGTECEKPISDMRFALSFSGLIGWGPLRTSDFFFNTHYRYSQNWGSEPQQLDIFMKYWPTTKKAADFLFPTKGLLRTHEWVSDFRYVRSALQGGLFSRFTWGRVGSNSLFRDAENLEEAETVVVTENFVPYLSYKYGKVYRGLLSFPMRTELNHDDPRLSNQTYSLSGRGRGYLVSTKLNNAFYVAPIDSLLYLDFFYLRYKFASLQNDKDRTGAAFALDFPVIWDIRAVPRATYYKEKFSVERVRIDGFRKGEANEKNTPSSLWPRQDAALGLGIYLYWEMSRTSRFDFSFQQEESTSNIPEFNITQTSWQLSYTWSWPSTSTVSKRVQRFSENNYAEDF